MSRGGGLGLAPAVVAANGPQLAHARPRPDSCVWRQGDARPRPDGATPTHPPPIHVTVDPPYAVPRLKTSAWRACPTLLDTRRIAPAWRPRTRTETSPAPRPRAPAEKPATPTPKDKTHRRGSIYYILSSTISSFKTCCRGAAFNSPTHYVCKEPPGHGKTGNFTCLQDTFST